MSEGLTIEGTFQRLTEAVERAREEVQVLRGRKRKAEARDAKIRREFQVLLVQKLQLDAEASRLRAEKAELAETIRSLGETLRLTEKKLRDAVGAQELAALEARALHSETQQSLAALERHAKDVSAIRRELSAVYTSAFQPFTTQWLEMEKWAKGEASKLRKALAKAKQVSTRQELGTRLAAEASTTRDQLSSALEELHNVSISRRNQRVASHADEPAAPRKRRWGE